MAYYAARYSGFEKIVSIMDRLIPERGRWLDIGCGLGVLLEIAHAHGWEVHGVEPSAICVELCQRRMSYAHIVHGTAEEALTEFNKFNIVSMTDVFRSIREPGQVLASMYEALACGGWILVRERNAKLHRYLRAMERPAPLQEWTPDSLQKALRLTGFRNVHAMPSPVFIEIHEDAHDGRLLSAVVKRTMKLGLWPASRIVHRLSGGRVYLGPNFLALGQK